MSNLEADPASIVGLAGTVSAQAWALSDALPAFSADALGVNDAFGVLGPAQEILTEYLDMANDCVAGLGDLVEALATASTNLETTADRYEGADITSTFAP